MNYKGVIIEESLEDKSVLRLVKVLRKRIEEVTSSHKTPWLDKWTLDAVEIPETDADQIAEMLSRSIDSKHNSWYADFKNDKYHYIVFRDKIFKVDRYKPKEYQAATDYGISIGIPDYQVDFAPNVKIWKR